MTQKVVVEPIFVGQHEVHISESDCLGPRLARLIVGKSGCLGRDHLQHLHRRAQQGALAKGAGPGGSAAGGLRRQRPLGRVWELAGRHGRDDEAGARGADLGQARHAQAGGLEKDESVKPKAPFPWRGFTRVRVNPGILQVECDVSRIRGLCRQSSQESLNCACRGVRPSLLGHAKAGFTHFKPTLLPLRRETEQKQQKPQFGISSI